MIWINAAIVIASGGLLLVMWASERLMGESKELDNVLDSLSSDDKDALED